MPVAGSEPVGPASQQNGGSRWAELTSRLRDFARRHSTAITILGSLATAAALAYVLSGRLDEFADALSDAAIGVLAVAALLQIVALLARSEAWHLTIGAAGGTVGRRVLYRASSMQVLGGMINGQLGVAARIAALRHSSPEVSPQVPTLIAAEFPILAVEGMLAALASFTLVEPLGLPWWLPLIGVAVIAAVSAGLRQLALRQARKLWKGLAVLRSLGGGSRVIGFVLVAVFAQIFRNWLLLQAVGVDASFFDAAPGGDGEGKGTEFMPGTGRQSDKDAPRCRRGATGGLERGGQSTQHGVAGGMLCCNVEATGRPGISQRHQGRQQVTISHGLEGAVREHPVEHALDLDRVEAFRRLDKSLDQVRCRRWRDLLDRGRR